MGFLYRLKQRIKKQETPLDRRLYRLAKAVRGTSVPVVGPFHRFLYKEWVTRRSMWHNFWRVVYYEPMFKSMCKEVGPGFRLEYAGNGSTTILGELDIYLGENVTMYDNTFFTGSPVGERSELRVGDNTYLAPFTRIGVAKSVTIGKWGLVGCRFISDNSGHPVTDVMGRMTSGGGSPSLKSVKPVSIGDFVFLGTQTVVYPGTTIGDGVVAQIGAHLSGNLPPFTLVGGNPCRVMGKLPIPEELKDVVGEERYQGYLDAHAKLEL